MTTSRRTFLRVLGSAAVAAVAPPVPVPANRERGLVYDVDLP
jgi:hypothetical protein